MLYGFVNHEMTTTYLGSTTGPAAAPRAADRPLRLHRQDHRPDQQRLGRRRDPRLRRRRRRWRWTPSWPSGSAGAQRRVDLPAGRYDTILPPTAVADLMIDAYWSAGARGRPRGPVGLQPPRRRHPDRRADRARRGATCSPTRRTPASSARRSSSPPRSGNESVGLRQRPAARAHRLDPRRRADRADPDPALAPR